MPNDKKNKLPDDGDIKGPTPPENPVEYARWLQRPRVNPNQPEVQPNDSALRPKGLKKPDINRSITSKVESFLRSKISGLSLFNSSYNLGATRMKIL